MKILCLGNEFIKQDSLAKEISKELEKEMKKLEFIMLKDSFQLIEYLGNNSEIIIIDVVKKLEKTRILSIEELESNSILTAHDFDAGFFLKLLGDEKKIKIIGIPMKGDFSEIRQDVKNMLIS